MFRGSVWKSKMQHHHTSPTYNRSNTSSQIPGIFLKKMVISYPLPSNIDVEINHVFISNSPINRPLSTGNRAVSRGELAALLSECLLPALEAAGARELQSIPNARRLGGKLCFLSMKRMTMVILTLKSGVLTFKHGTWGWRWVLTVNMDEHGDVCCEKWWF